MHRFNNLTCKAMNSISAIWHMQWIATHNSGDGTLLQGSFIIFICLVNVVSLTYFAIYKIRPESFKVNVSITKHAMFSLEVKSSQQPANRTVEEEAGSADG